MRVQSMSSTIVLLISSTLPLCSGALVANESDTYFTLGNDRFVTHVNKGLGYIDYMTLDGQDLLGPRAGSTGIGPYLDCYCIPSGSYTPGSANTVFKLFQGVDSSNVAYGGVVMTNVYVPTGQLFEQYWFLRDGETGLHTFSRLAYHNSTTPFLRNLQEFRTLFRPSTSLWTHLITDESFYAPLPNPNPATGNSANSTTVQDATWYLGNRTNDAYVEQMADYFTNPRLVRRRIA
ncbi:hypothetical protein ONZ43_g4277 [Nemania bipapillata]|uniref:Uncharacterized protein n=1 Tax=Nemania bipapillata TaxID=110536 RepID=A0ACC2IPS9_9PEZI|nr:hypothetical protein ONZ43_g4277 [Nemania bipapillata]